MIWHSTRPIPFRYTFAPALNSSFWMFRNLPMNAHCNSRAQTHTSMSTKGCGATA